MLPLSRIIISKFKTGKKKERNKAKIVKKFNFIPSVRAIELYQYVSNMSKKRKKHRLKRFFANILCSLLNRTNLNRLTYHRGKSNITKRERCFSFFFFEL